MHNRIHYMIIGILQPHLKSQHTQQRSRLVATTLDADGGGNISRHCRGSNIAITSAFSASMGRLLDVSQISEMERDKTESKQKKA